MTSAPSDRARLEPTSGPALAVRGCSSLCFCHRKLHLLHRRRRGVDVHQRVIRLAVLLDAEGEGLQTPVFHLADLAAIGLENAAELLDELEVELTYREYDMGHQINSDCLRDLSDWLTARLDVD